MDDRQLRGGPVVNSREWIRRRQRVERLAPRRYRNLDLEHYWDRIGGRSTLSRDVAVRPAPNVSISFGPSWNPSHLTRQYWLAVEDPTPWTSTGRGTWSRRSISGRWDSIRVSAGPSRPRMTLELLHAAVLRAAHYFGLQGVCRAANDAP